MKARVMTLLAVTLLAGAACDYEYVQEVSREEDGSARIPLGTLDGDCIDDDDSDGVTYTRREENGAFFCNIVTEWNGALVDMQSVRDSIDEGIRDEGVPDQVQTEDIDVEFTDVSLNHVAITLVKPEDDGTPMILGFPDVTFYNVNVTIDDVGGLVDVGWPDPDNVASGPDTPYIHVDESNKDDVLSYFERVYENQETVPFSGRAELEFKFETEEDLLEMDGAELNMAFTLDLKGEGSYSMSNLLGGQ